MGRHPVSAALLCALVIGAGAFTALSATTPAGPEAEPAPTGNVPPVPNNGSDPAALAVARKAAAEAGQGVAPGSMRLTVAASSATAGYALWSWITNTGQPANMIVNPKGTPVMWSGCRSEPVVYIDRCAGWATPAGILVLAGRAGPKVVSVEVAGDHFGRRPAVLGNGGWMWVGRGIPPNASAARVPDRVIARGADGASYTISVAP